MADFTWEDNSEKIYETAISLSPGPFRKITKKTIDEALLAKVGDGGTINEVELLEIINENTPKPFRAMGMRKLKPLMTSK
jgi:hypothetical protein